MAIGRPSRNPSRSACVRSNGRARFWRRRQIRRAELPESTIRQKLGTPNAERVYYIAGPSWRLTEDDIFALSKIDPWFLRQLREIF